MQEPSVIAMNISTLRNVYKRVYTMEHTVAHYSFYNILFSVSGKVARVVGMYEGKGR